jgi:hypothetical protein
VGEKVASPAACFGPLLLPAAQHTAAKTSALHRAPSCALDQ